MLPHPNWPSPPLFMVKLSVFISSTQRRNRIHFCFKGKWSVKTQKTLSLTLCSWGLLSLSLLSLGWQMSFFKEHPHQLFFFTSFHTLLFLHLPLNISDFPISTRPTSLFIFYILYGQFHPDLFTANSPVFLKYTTASNLCPQPNFRNLAISFNLTCSTLNLST